MRRSSSRRSLCPRRCGCFGWSLSMPRLREQRIRTISPIGRVTASRRRNPPNAIVAVPPIAAANLDEGDMNAQVAAPPEIADRRVLARNIHVVVGYILG